ncbi:hypothetical protein BDF14DRAFT_1773820 [Spinellus fusiger]|nr:hypothetical protein BDF14DRAFT_1773820 [Spinellus fusiger]
MLLEQEFNIWEAEDLLCVFESVQKTGNDLRLLFKEVEWVDMLSLIFQNELGKDEWKYKETVETLNNCSTFNTLCRGLNDAYTKLEDIIKTISSSIPYRKAEFGRFDVFEMDTTTNILDIKLEIPNEDNYKHEIRQLKNTISNLENKHRMEMNRKRIMSNDKHDKEVFDLKSKVKLMKKKHSYETHLFKRRLDHLNQRLTMMKSQQTTNNINIDKLKLQLNNTRKRLRKRIQSKISSYKRFGKRKALIKTKTSILRTGVMNSTLKPLIKKASLFFGQSFEIHSQWLIIAQQLKEMIYRENRHIFTKEQKHLMNEDDKYNSSVYNNLEGSFDELIIDLNALGKEKSSVDDSKKDSHEIHAANTQFHHTICQIQQRVLDSRKVAAYV